MEPELNDLLRSVGEKCTSGAWTHATLYNGATKWKVAPENYGKFWDKYCDLVMKDNKNSLCLSESVQQVIPLISNFRLKFQMGDDDEFEPYDDHFLQKICATYQKILVENFMLTEENDAELCVIILESDHWTEESNGENYMNLDIRLQFPYAKIALDLQNKVIRPKVIQSLRNSNVLSQLERQPIGDWEDIIYKYSQNGHIVMYGSSENKNVPKLRKTHIWGDVTEILDDTEYDFVIEDYEIEDILSLANHAHVQNGLIDPHLLGQSNPERLLPLFLSVDYWNKFTMVKTDKIQMNKFDISPHHSQMPFGFNTNQNKNNDLTNADMCEVFIKMLNHDRFTKESFWLDIGKALYNANNGDENGVLSWIGHSERIYEKINSIPNFLSDKNIEEHCKNIYRTFTNEHITVKTLAWYARQDAPRLYSSWHMDWCNSSMESALSLTHTDVAYALYKIYWLDFAYVPYGTGKWFQFNKHRWEEDLQNLSFNKLISTDFVKRFEHIRVLLAVQIRESNDETFSQNAEIGMKKLGRLINELKNQPFKRAIVSEAKEYFNNQNFISLLDTNCELTGVINGVLEICGDHIMFRSTKPEDYISICANVPYESKLHWKHDLVKECMKWFGQIFVDEELLHHFLKFCSSILKGRNSDKIFPIMTGEGDNSKSMIVKLFESTLGPYCMKFDVSNVTSRNGNASGPTPQLARAKSKRVAFMDEPADDIPINKENIKRWVGGDSFFARMLQDNGADIKVSFKLIMMCNKIPIIPHADRAIKNRTRIFPFESTWVDDAPEDENEQYRLRRFKKDGDFEKRIPVMAPAFIWIMSQYFPFYSKEGLVDPSIVIERTEAYWRDNDLYAQFASENVQLVVRPDGTSDKSASVTLTSLYERFRSWYRDAFPGSKPPDRQAFKNELNSRWGRMHQNRWYGIRLLSEDSDEYDSYPDANSSTNQNSEKSESPEISRKSPKQFSISEKLKTLGVEIEPHQNFHLNRDKPHSQIPV